MSNDFDYMSATSLRKLIVGKNISPVELVERALGKAESAQADLNCFFVIDSEGARAAARRAETAVMQGMPLGLLHGLPVSVKDLIAVGGLPYALYQSPLMQTHGGGFPNRLKFVGTRRIQEVRRGGSNWSSG